MSEKERVVVALSGGVGSAVACGSLKQAGYEVIAVFMRLASPDEPMSAALKGNLSQVQRIADILDVELQIVDYSWEIQQVIQYFIYEYARGRTPNPCARCNRVLKFGRLISFARHLGASALATGHYARIVDRAGIMRLARAIAGEKDQSYVLFGIRRPDLSYVMFPNGQLAGKNNTRELARALKLPVHDKQDSQEICFVPDDDYVRFLLKHVGKLDRPGPVIDLAGNKLGEHNGVFRYTIGQRRGLRIAAGHPLYVLRIDVTTNTIVVGTREQLLKGHLTAGELNWHEAPPGRAVRVDAQIRSAHQAVPATVEPIDSDRVHVTFEQHQYAVTPGQAVVFYRDDIVVGGGWILPDV